MENKLEALIKISIELDNAQKEYNEIYREYSSIMNRFIKLKEEVIPRLQIQKEQMAIQITHPLIIKE